MNAGTLAALGSAWLLGVLIVAACRPPGSARVREDGALLAALGLLVGLGVTGSGYFLASLGTPRPAVVAGAGELAAGLMLAWRGWRHRRPPVAPPAGARPAAPGLQWLLAAGLVQALVVALACGWRSYQAEPYGGWDGWAIWNLHARMMARAGTEWPALLTEPAISWTHPDYPRLLPAAVARTWAWTGAETPAAAALVSTAFAAGGLGVLLAVAHRRRGGTIALAGALFLVGTPFFVTFAPNQHADIPLGSFLLASLALLALAGGERELHSGWLLLAGLTAGFAAGTKNEGQLFALVFLVAGGGWVWRHGGVRAFGALAAGLAAALAPVILFKAGLAPGNDLLAAPWGPRLAQFVDSARHVSILTAFGRELRRFGEWTWTPYLAMALPFVAWRARRRLVQSERPLPVILAAMLGGYYGVYLLTPQDLAWHLDNSLVRLLLQLWPLAILLWCLVVPAPELERGWRPGRWGMAGFVAVNVAVAFAVATPLARQLAPGELARGHGRAAGVTVALGEGWHPAEWHGRDHWAWSPGRAVLLVEQPAAPAADAVPLRFQLRATGERIVSVRREGRVLWQGAVAGGFVPVVLDRSGWPAGLARLEFSTATPGVPEAPRDGGRVLAFAIYNAELR